LARDGLAELAQAGLPADGSGGGHRQRPALRPAPRVRIAAHSRGTDVRRGDRRAARAQPDRVPRGSVRSSRSSRRKAVAADKSQGTQLSFTGIAA
jgi:hypothetical protein